MAAQRKKALNQLPSVGSPLPAVDRPSRAYDDKRPTQNVSRGGPIINPRGMGFPTEGKSPSEGPS